MIPSAAGAIAAYRQMQGVAAPALSQPAQDTTAIASPGAGFADMLGEAAQAAIGTGEKADALSLDAVRGSGGDLTQVVTAVNQAELALQTTTAIRDRVLSAYHDILSMAI